MLNYTTIHTTIGKTFADKQDEVILSSGNITYTRRDFIETLGNANFIAAARLAKVLRRLGVKSIKQLASLDAYSLYRAKGIGDTAVYVAMCILDKEGYDVIKWWDKDPSKTRRAKKRKQEV